MHQRLVQYFALLRLLRSLTEIKSTITSFQTGLDHQNIQNWLKLQILLYYTGLHDKIHIYPFVEDLIFANIEFTGFFL